MKIHIKKIGAFLFAAVMMLSAVPVAFADTQSGTLQLVAAADIQVHLYTGFGSTKDELAPFVSQKTAEPEEEGEEPAELRIYTFKKLPVGCYTYVASGEGYYSVSTNLYFSEQDAEKGLTVEVNPGKKAGNGYEPNGTVMCPTVGTVEKNLGVEEALAEAYAQVLTTPAFAEEKAANEFTSQEEMEHFIAELNKTGDNMYVYSLGVSGEKRNIPIVIFTRQDLSDAATLEAAAEILKADEKPMVHYQAQIHGDEPSSGEGALAVIAAMQGDLGEKVLDSLNLYVIPRVNPDGAYAFTRENSGGVDMNRDHMRVQTKEIQLVHRAYNLLKPDVTIDGHEFTGETTETSGTLIDVEVGVAGGLNIPTELTAQAKSIRDGMFEDGNEKGLCMYIYAPYESSANYATGRGYYGLQGSLSFLVETRGLQNGKVGFERRVLSQYWMVESILTRVAENAETVTATVDAARGQIAAKGRSYDEKNELVLSNTASKSDFFYLTVPTYDLRTGEVGNADNQLKVYDLDQAFRSRTCPTAYVIPKDASYAAEAVKILTANGATYYEIAAGAKAYLQQYSGNKSEAEVGEEALISLPAGAYVFPMNQEAALVIAMTLEPDVTDTNKYNGTLAQSGLLKEGANMQLYRCIRTLDDNGCVPLEGSFAWVIWPIIGAAVILVVLALAIVFTRKKKNA